MTPETEQLETSNSWQIMMRRRLIFVLLCCTVWSILLIGRLSHFMIFSRDKYIDQMVKAAVHERITPALRGRIVDQDGIAYAWSVRHFDFIWQVPRNREDRQNDLRLLKAHFPKAPVVKNGQAVMQKNLNSAQVKILIFLVKHNNSSFKIQSRFSRHYRSGFSQKLGKVKSINGVITGVSGYEKEFDRRLRGVDRCIRFLVGEGGTVVEDSCSVISEMQQGKDVYIEEL